MKGLLYSRVIPLPTKDCTIEFWLTMIEYIENSYALKLRRVTTRELFCKSGVRTDTNPRPLMDQCFNVFLVFFV